MEYGIISLVTCGNMWAVSYQENFIDKYKYKYKYKWKYRYEYKSANLFSQNLQENGRCFVWLRWWVLSLFALPNLFLHWQQDNLGDENCWRNRSDFFQQNIEKLNSPLLRQCDLNNTQWVSMNCNGKGKKPSSITPILPARLPFVLKRMRIEYHCIAIKMSKSVPVYLTFPSINYHHHPDPREIVETSRNAPQHEWRVCRWTKKELDKQNRCHHHWDPLSHLQHLHCCSWEFDKTAPSPKMLASLFSSRLSLRLRAFSETSGVEIFDHICHRRTLFCQPPLGQRSS